MKNYKDRNFDKRISHLNSFIGMPMWNGRNPSISEIRAFDRRQLEQQALEQQTLKKKEIKFEYKKQRFIRLFKEGLVQKVRNFKNRIISQQKITECCE